MSLKYQYTLLHPNDKLFYVLCCEELVYTSGNTLMEQSDSAHKSST